MNKLQEYEFRDDPELLTFEYVVSNCTLLPQGAGNSDGSMLSHWREEFIRNAYTRYWPVCVLTGEEEVKNGVARKEAPVESQDAVDDSEFAVVGLKLPGSHVKDVRLLSGNVAETVFSVTA